MNLNLNPTWEDRKKMSALFQTRFTEIYKIWTYVSHQPLRALSRGRKIHASNSHEKRVRETSVTA